jgi:[ribosomal protein S5]-alanine N-acetyltransferase
MYIFESERLGFRTWLERDTEPFIQMNADPEVMEFFPGLLTPEQAIAYIGRITTFHRENNFGLWAIDEKASGKFIGFIGLTRATFESPFTPCIEIGWRLAKAFWGKGYATEGATACLEYGFGTLGLSEINSFTAVTNTRSVHVMQKIGMKHVLNFDHTTLPEGHPLRPHVLYKIEKPV